MATTQIYAPIFRTGAYDLLNSDRTPATNGIVYSFPVDKVTFIPTTVVANGVQMNAVIILAPQALNQPAQTYYTTYTVANLNSYANGGAEPTTTTTTAAPTTSTTTTAP